MVKIVGIDNQDFIKCSLKDVIDYFQDKEWIEVDTETTGFDAYRAEILCIQLGDKDNQFVIGGYLVKRLKPLLESRLLLLQNAKFDLKFLYFNGIWPERIYDTMLAEGVIHCGKKQIRRSLAAIAKRRLNVDLDKSVRDAIWEEGLTTRVIQYAADDVKYLDSIRQSQALDIERLNLQNTVELENEFVIVLAYMEFCGFKLDVEKWKKKIEKDKKSATKAKEKLDKFILENNIEKFISLQLDLFSPGISVSINWDSSKQVIELFKSLGIPVQIVKAGEIKESVEAKNMLKQGVEFPIVKDYLHYKECQKLCSTYGHNFIEQINPVTGRIHTNFQQIKDTGRLSSGGKNKETKESYLNFQNIPAESFTRSCFIAEQGNSLCQADYSGQEQIILANKSLDEGLLEFYDKGYTDMHSFVASRMFPELKDVEHVIIAKKHKAKRQKAKITGLAMNYGASEFTVGKEAYEGYFNAFPSLRQYFNKSKQEGLRNGFLLINDITNRKSFIDGYEEYISLNKEINRAFWDKWKVIKPNPAHPLYPKYKQKISKYFKLKGNIERVGLNFGIQGSGADMMKIAGMAFFKWIRQKGWIGIVKICNMIHDEWVPEAPDEIIKEVADKLDSCMREAGSLFCKRVPIKIDVQISKFWIKED